jgi:hypothetical protein
LISVTRPRRYVVLKFAGLAREFALLIARRLLRLHAVGLRHDRAFLRHLFLARLQVVLHRHELAAPRRELVLEILHRALRLRRLFQKTLEIDDANLDFGMGRLAGDETADEQTQ